MAQNTVNNPGCCDELVDILVKRLAKNSTDVKLKALRAIHFVARRGSVHFRRSMQRQTTIIRSHLNIRGNPHPVHGDAPWRFIRDTAKACMNSIFDTSNDDAQPVVKKKMEGFGGGSGFQAGQDEFRNAPAGGGSVGGSGGAGNFDARTQQGGIMGKALGIAQAAKNQAQSFAEQNQYAAKAMQMGQQVAGAVGVPGMGTQQANAYQSADGATQQPQFGQPQFGQPQFGAPGGFNMPGNETQVQAPAGSFGEGGMPQQPQASAMPKRIKVEAGEYEAKIIDDLCEPSGARPNPSKEVLNNFVKQCGSLDANLVCALLEEKLEDEDWRVVLKALAGIEVLVTTKKAGVADYFDGNDEFIQEIAVDPESQKSLKTAAERCLKAFKAAKDPGLAADNSMDMFSGMMDMGGDMDMNMGAAPAAPAATMDLSFMGNMSGPVTLAAPPAPAAPAPAPPPPVDPLFGGIGGTPAGGVGAAAVPAPAPAAPNLLAGFGAPAAPAPAPPPPGGMDIMGMFAAAPAPAAPGMMPGMMGMPAQQPQAGMMPGMMGMPAQQPQAGMMPGMMGMPAQQPQAGMMPGMMGAPAPAPSPSGGAFDFLG